MDLNQALISIAKDLKKAQGGKLTPDQYSNITAIEKELTKIENLKVKISELLKENL